MRAAQRHAFLLERMNQKGTVKIVDIARELKIAPATVRRDIKQMADQGLLERIHGGAARLAYGPAPEASRLPTTLEVHFANVALDMITPSSVIGIGSGSLCYALMIKLCQSALAKDLTVVTYSLSIVKAAHDWHSQERGMTVLFAGGLLRQDLATGEYASRFLRRITTDMCFLQPEGIDRQSGLMSEDPAIAPVIETSTNHSRRVVAMIPSDMWHTKSYVSVCPLTRVDTIITTGDVPSFIIPALRAYKVAVRGARSWNE